MLYPHVPSGTDRREKRSSPVRCRMTGNNKRNVCRSSFFSLLYELCIPCFGDQPQEPADSHDKRTWIPYLFIWRRRAIWTCLCPFSPERQKDGFEQLQIFIEPKGTQLLEKDAWKEKFLLQLKTEAVPATVFVDDNDYKIWGLHFFNQDNRMKEFDSEFATLSSQ